MGIAVDGSQVILILESPAKNIWMSPVQARRVAQIMIQKCDMIEGRGSSIIVPGTPGGGLPL